MSAGCSGHIDCMPKYRFNSYDECNFYKYCYLLQCLGVSLSAKWTVKSLLEEFPDLGAVIDLTNTKRYYNPEELISAGVKHKKILMEGRIVPPESKVREFIATMDKYLGQNDCSLVGVHCTHGLNRTGYMVCRYMRDRLGIPAHVAITMFETARGYRMERQNLIGNLLHVPWCEPYHGSETTVVPVNRSRRRRIRRRY